MLIAIDISENPMYAITTPPIEVGTPPAMASHPIHLGYVRPDRLCCDLRLNSAGATGGPLEVMARHRASSFAQFFDRE